MEVLKPYRKKIDDLDDRLVDLLGQRYEIIRQVAALKAELGIPAVLPDRVEEVRERCVRRGETLGLNPAFVRTLYTLMIDHACALEDRLMAQQRGQDLDNADD